MKTFLTILLLFSGCAAHGAYQGAMQYPALFQEVYSGTMLKDSTAYYVRGYDLDRDGLTAEVYFMHLITFAAPGEVIETSTYPKEIVYPGKKGKFGRQHDDNMDGEIDSVSGDVKLILKWLNVMRGFSNLKNLARGGDYEGD